MTLGGPHHLYTCEVKGDRGAQHPFLGPKKAFETSQKIVRQFESDHTIKSGIEWDGH